MRFRIDNQIFQSFAYVTIGVVVVKGVSNHQLCQPIARLTRQEEERIRLQFELTSLSQDSRINLWREAYRSFGVKPGDARSSVENLYRVVLKGAELRAINKLVDIYNLISLRHMVPVGGEDLDNIIGDLRLTFAKDEKPVKLLGDAEPETPVDGEVIYKDDHSTICRRWNWREADRTKLTENTTNAIFVIEGISLSTKENIPEATNDLAAMIEKYCGGETILRILDKDKPELEL